MSCTLINIHMFLFNELCVILSSFCSFDIPLKLLISFIFLLGGITLYKIRTIILTISFQYDSRVQTEADSECSCVLDALNLCKGHKNASWRIFQRKFLILYC
jgi:hypothetical protein